MQNEGNIDDRNIGKKENKNVTKQNAKIMDLQAKKVGFKKSIEGLKSDMSTIAMGFREQLLSSTAGLAEIHKNQVIYNIYFK